MKNILGKILIILTLPILLNATSSFTLKLSKDKVYVGEAIKATLTLTYDLESPIMRTDFDEFLGVSKTQRDKLGKPTAVYNKYKELEEKNDGIIKDVEDLFNLLVNPQDLNHKISNPDGSEWEYQDNGSVAVPEASFNDL